MSAYVWRTSRCARTRIWKSQWQPYQSGGPRGGAHGVRGERPTNQGPNIGCQEFSYLDAAPGKSQAFPRKFFCRHDGIDTRYRPGSGVKACTIRGIQEATRNVRRVRCQRFFDKKGSIYLAIWIVKIEHKYFCRSKRFIIQVIIISLRRKCSLIPLILKRIGGA